MECACAWLAFSLSLFLSLVLGAADINSLPVQLVPILSKAACPPPSFGSCWLVARAIQPQPGLVYQTELSRSTRLFSFTRKAICAQVPACVPCKAVSAQVPACVAGPRSLLKTRPTFFGTKPPEARPPPPQPRTRSTAPLRAASHRIGDHYQTYSSTFDRRSLPIPSPNPTV